MALIENGRDLLYRYITPEKFKKRYGVFHPDPMIEEFTYGEGSHFSQFVWNNVNVGSRIFFHTERCITTMYYIKDFAPAAIWRLDEDMRAKYQNHHLHPENYPGWSDYDSKDKQFDIEVKDAYESGTIYVSVDVLLIGDPERSFDIRKDPLVLDRDLLSKLEMQGKPVKWNIMNKNGKELSEGQCISACLRSPRVLSKRDGDILEKLVKDHASRQTPTSSPVTNTNVEIKNPDNNVKVPKKDMTIKEKSPVDPKGPTTHDEIQWLLLKLGSDMGLDIWVARNDRNKSVNGHKFTEIPRLKGELPIYLDPEMVKKIELIDVLWLKRNAIVAAFEIESTTSIYSGLLRMSDLTHALPNLQIPLYLVAPEERRERVMIEVNRPAFSQASSPLSEICRYISFTTLKQGIYQTDPEMLPYLKPRILKHWSESCDQR